MISEAELSCLGILIEVNAATKQDILISTSKGEYLYDEEKDISIINGGNNGIWHSLRKYGFCIGWQRYGSKEGKFCAKDSERSR